MELLYEYDTKERSKSLSTALPSAVKAHDSALRHLEKCVIARDDDGDFIFIRADHDLEKAHQSGKETGLKHAYNVVRANYEARHAVSQASVSGYRNLIHID